MDKSQVLKDLRAMKADREREVRELERAIAALEPESKPKKPKAANGEKALVLDVNVVCDLIRRHGPITVEQLVEHTGCTEKQAKRELNFHKKYGTLELVDGKYAKVDVDGAKT